MDLLASVRRAIEYHALWRPGARILAAVSGGADSVALLYLLRELDLAGEVRLVGLAHLNHQLRGADADQDAAFCESLAATMGIRAIVDRENVAALAAREARSIEDAARQARLAFFARAAAATTVDAVAVAHTHDDQAETFLLRLIRGAGTRGLAAIQPRNGVVARPLLEVTRADLREYLRASGGGFREDASNADLSLQRNRVRRELIPYLESHFSQDLSAVLARSASLARDDEEFLHAQAIDLLASVVLSDTGPIILDRARLAGAPRALASRVAQIVLERGSQDRPVGFGHVEALLALAAAELDKTSRGRSGLVIDLPGQRAVRDAGTIRLVPGALPAAANCFEFSLSIPGEVRLDRGVTVAAEAAPGPAAGGRRPTEWASRGPEVAVAAESLALPLSVRSRRPGDRFQPLGAPGGRKLQDFLVDRKIPRHERDRLPLVVDGRNRIVWVAGQAVGEPFRVLTPSAAVILLKVRHLGGAG